MLRDRRGVALMLALWLTVVLGTIAVGVAALVRGQANVVANVHTRAAARYAAESGILAATWRLKQVLRAAETPRDQALVFRHLDRVLADLQEERVGEGAERFQVAVVDLNARLDLNNADEPTLIAFFTQFAGPRDAPALAAALQDWRDADDLVHEGGGAEAADYERAGSLFRPPNRPLQRLDELTRIKGFSDSLADRIAPYVTVRGDGRVNLNTAPAVVLAPTLGIGPAGASVIESKRINGEVFTSLGDVWRILPQGSGVGGGRGIDISRLTTMPKRLLFISRGWEVGTPLTHEIQAIYDLDAVQLTTGPRLELRFWTERDR